MSERSRVRTPHGTKIGCLKQLSTTAYRVVSGGAPKGPGLIESVVSSSWDLVEISGRIPFDLINPSVSSGEEKKLYHSYIIYVRPSGFESRP